MRSSVEFSICGLNVGAQKILDFGVFWIFRLAMLYLYHFSVCAMIAKG
jgi:hypothetical protein